MGRPSMRAELTLNRNMDEQVRLCDRLEHIRGIVSHAVAADRNVTSAQLDLEGVIDQMTDVLSAFAEPATWGSLSNETRSSALVMASRLDKAASMMRTARIDLHMLGLGLKEYWRAQHERIDSLRIQNIEISRTAVSA